MEPGGFSSYGNGVLRYLRPSESLAAAAAASSSSYYYHDDT